MIAATFLFFFEAIQAQVFSDGQLFMHYPNLSLSCQSALNTSVSCPAALSVIAQTEEYLDQDSVDFLCQDSCLSSLQDAKSSITKACTSGTDVIVIEDVAYPATFFVDSFIHAFRLACRKDQYTGKYCDPQLLDWSNSSFNANQSCSDCWLAGLALQLESPLAYDSALASNFASLTAQCGSSQYSYSPTTTYALNTSDTATASFTPTSIPGCSGSYTVGANDNCTSVSQALGVSTYNLLYYNGLDMYCQGFDAIIGQTLCVPPICETYTWKAHDSCYSVVSKHTNVTLAQFLSWNPNLNDLCENSAAFIGYQFCIGTPGGALTATSPPNLPPSGIATTAAPVPTNARDGSNRDCGKWYTIQPDDTCGLVTVANSLSLEDFYFLNPSLDTNCTNLLLGIAYCIQPVGDITTYPHYTASETTLPITVSQASFDPVDTRFPSTTSYPGFTYTTTQLPIASGSFPNCTDYENQDSSDFSDCDSVAFGYQIAVSELLEWNPSLSKDLTSCKLAQGFSYCVRINDANTGGNQNCFQANSSIVVDGTTKDCKCFTIVHGYDSGDITCQSTCDDYGISLDQLVKWNSWLAGNCDDKLYTDLDTYEERAVCIGLNGTKPTTTSTPTETTTSEASMGPTPSDTVRGCRKFYTVKSGDGCNSIEEAFNISFSQLYSWNPSIGNNCQGLWLGYAYCVAGPPVTTTSVEPPGPTQSGIASDCNRYYKVVSGDGCGKIESQFSITFEQLYKWNPAIGDNCQSLWVGYAVCTGVSS